jgi:hypothetical protein
MKKCVTQTATRTISLRRIIVIEFPPDIDPELIDQSRLAAVLKEADVEWETEDEQFEIDSVEWSDADSDEDADVVYED